MPEEKEKKEAVKKPVKKAAPKTPKKETEKKNNKKTTDKKVVAKNVKKVIDPKTGKVVVVGQKKKAETKKPVDTKPKVEKKVPVKKKIVKKSSKELTIEPPARVEEEIVRPKPKKVKQLTKEEKLLYKELDNDFSFVANMTNVIEDRTMDRKSIPDLTIGELHVIETVNKHNNKPMTLIAKHEHVTVGALTICVNRLVQKGYLLRTRDEMDHRIILLSVTQKAKKVMKTHDEFHENILGLVLENGVSISQAHKVMSVFAKYLEGYYDPKSLEETPKKGKKK